MKKASEIFCIDSLEQEETINKDNETYSFLKWQLYKLSNFSLECELAGVSDKSCLTTKWMFVE